MASVLLDVRGLSASAGGDPGAAPILTLERLDLAGGQLVTLEGPSGSGKSTLLYLLSGLLLPGAGSVSWSGTDLCRLGELARDRWRRKHAGFVFQNFHLMDELTPLDNVLVPVWFASASARGHRARAEALLGRFGLPEGRRRAGQLSRGEQQRVALARALIHDPRVIFADEPTASLDAASAALVAGTLARLAHDEGRLVIAASHDPLLHRLADQVLAIRRGAEVAISSPERAR